MSLSGKYSRLLRVMLLSLLTAGLLLTFVPEGNPGESAIPESPSSVFLQSLTEEERAWLHAHPLIRVAQDPGWMPIEFSDEKGEPSGMAMDYLRIVEKRLGIKFQLVKNLSWQEAYARLKRWEIDMTTSVAVTPERMEFWAFTKPYIKIPIVIVSHSDVTYIDTIKKLSGKQVAIVDGYAVNDWIPRDFPEIRLVRVKSVQQGLELLQQGRVFAYIDNMLVVGYYMAKLKMTGLKIAGETPYVNAQSMAVRKDWVIFTGILDKAIDSISEGERNDIYQKWLPIRYEHGFNYRILWQTLAIFAVILFGLILWIRKLTIEIRSRKKAEADAKENAGRFYSLFEAAALPLCLVNQEGIITHVNNYFVHIFGYTLKDVPTLAEWWRLAYPDPDYRQGVIESWNKSLQIARERQDRIQPMEYRVTCKNGETRTMLITGTVLGTDFLAAFFDITGQKLAENEQRQFFNKAERSRRALLSTIEDQRQSDKALLEKVTELERYHDLTIDREINMIELKKEVNTLLREFGREEKYRIVK